VGAFPPSPVYDEVLVGGLLVADGTHPGGLLLVHLDVECRVEALQVRARQRSARDGQPHLPQLAARKTPGVNNLFLGTLSGQGYC